MILTTIGQKEVTSLRGLLEHTNVETIGASVHLCQASK